MIANGQLMMHGEQVEPVEEFCYLGSILTNNGIAVQMFELELLKQT